MSKSQLRQFLMFTFTFPANVPFSLVHSEFIFEIYGYVWSESLEHVNVVFTRRSGFGCTRDNDISAIFRIHSDPLCSTFAPILSEFFLLDRFYAILFFSTLQRFAGFLSRIKNLSLTPRSEWAAAACTPVVFA